MVRVCEATYDTAPVEKEGIQVLVSSVEAESKTNVFPSSLYPLPPNKRLFDTTLLILSVFQQLMEEKDLETSFLVRQKLHF